ncbi:MAG: phage terminase large subunit, partial [Actinomycetota bacterium]
MTAPDVVIHSYRPRGAALDLFRCRDPEVLLSGPAGTGKSRACLEKLDQLALRNPVMKGLIVRKTLASLGATALDTYRKHVAAEALEAGLVRYYGGSRQEPAQYVYGNGSAIHIGGMDKATKIMSSEYDAIYVQEAIELTEDDWEALTTRLRNGMISFQQLLADTNPSA